MKPRPPTPASIPTKLTVNFVLPYASELSAKEVSFLYAIFCSLVNLGAFVHGFCSFRLFLSGLLANRGFVAGSAVLNLTQVHMGISYLVLDFDGIDASFEIDVN